jgi:uncharacterized protein (TIGR02757 family)
MTLKTVLDRLGRERGADFLANDPLSFAHRYRHPADRELAAFLSAALAYGRVASIRASLEDLFGRLPEGPAAFIGGFDPGRDAQRLNGFRHRFNDGADIVVLCWLLKQMVEAAGSLEGFFLAGDSGGEDIGEALSSFCRRALAFDVTAVLGRAALPPRAGVRYFFANPADGSACKRLCMFLRWVCRPDDGIDLGLWRSVSPSRLVIPLDTHTARISRLLGLSSRTSADWRMAREVTATLRALDPADPVRYDFALAHLGISEGCQGRSGTWCIPCPVAGLCAVSLSNRRYREEKKF